MGVLVAVGIAVGAVVAVGPVAMVVGDGAVPPAIVIRAGVLVDSTFSPAESLLPVDGPATERIWVDEPNATDVVDPPVPPMAFIVRVPTEVGALIAEVGSLPVERLIRIRPVL